MGKGSDSGDGIFVTPGPLRTKSHKNKKHKKSRTSDQETVIEAHSTKHKHSSKSDKQTPQRPTISTSTPNIEIKPVSKGKSSTQKIQLPFTSGISRSDSDESSLQLVADSLDMPITSPIHPSLDTDTELLQKAGIIQHKSSLDSQDESPKKKKKKRKSKDHSDALSQESGIEVLTQSSSLDQDHPDDVPSPRKKSKKKSRTHDDDLDLDETGRDQSISRLDRRRKSRPVCRYQCPVDYTQSSLTSHDQLTLSKEDLENDDVELFLCQVPFSVDPSELDGHQIDLSESFLMDSGHNEDDDRRPKLAVRTTRQSEDRHGLTILAPSQDTGHLDIVQKQFSGTVTICEYEDLQPYVLPLVQKKGKRELPPGLKQRYVPFGADHPQNSQKEVKHKKKKKKEKHKSHHS